MANVLHVVESYASGVASAIDEYASNSSGATHHVLFSPRSDAPIERDRLDIFTSATRMSRGHLARVKQVASLVAKLDIDVVHAHSTYGGVYARLAPIRSRKVKVVYTPHCYAFERLDLATWARISIRLVETLLTRRTDTTAGCSEREVELARRMSRSMKTTYLPNVLPAIQTRPGDGDSKLRIAGAGRVGFQKDPGFFAQLANQMSAIRPEIEFVWIGGGDVSLVDEMEAAGVTVTGWQSRPRVLELLAGCCVYVHTARWEGFPVGVLESIAAGVPALVRDTPSTASFPDCATFRTIEEAVGLICAYVDGVDGTDLLKAWELSTMPNTPDHQAAVLQQIYTEPIPLPGPFKRRGARRGIRPTLNFNPQEEATV